MDCLINEYTSLENGETQLFCEVHEADADNFSQCEDAE